MNATQRILVGSAATLSWQNVDQDGIAAAPSGAVTVGVTKADGTVVVASGTATSGSGSDPRTYLLSAANNATLQRLVATWTDAGDSSTATTYIDVVGSYYFTINELRERPGLENSAKYSDTKLIAARKYAEDLIESFCGVAFVPRFDRIRLKGTDTAKLTLPRWRLRSVKSARIYSSDDTYEDLTAGELAAIPASELPIAERTDGEVWTCAEDGTANVLIEYEHGFDNPPEDLKKAALDTARDFLLGDAKRISPRALDVTTEWGSIRYSQPGRERPTGIPDVDAIIVSHSRRVPGIA